MVPWSGTSESRVARSQLRPCSSTGAPNLPAMYRRGWLITAGVLIGLGLWIGSWSFTITTGGSFGSTPRDHVCGSTIGVFVQDEYAPGVEGTFLRPRCYLESKQRVASLGFLGAFAFGVAVVGLVRGPAPPLRSIDVLTPLPTKEEMEESWVGDPAYWP